MHCARNAQFHAPGRTIAASLLEYDVQINPWERPPSHPLPMGRSSCLLTRWTLRLPSRLSKQNVGQSADARKPGWRSWGSVWGRMLHCTARGQLHILASRNEGVFILPSLDCQTCQFSSQLTNGGSKFVVAHAMSSSYYKTSWTCPSSCSTFRVSRATSPGSRTPRKSKLELELGHVQLVL